jgi:hydroxypyruvate reductase
MSFDEMCSALSRYDIILPTLRDMFDASVFEAAASKMRCKLLANFGVGYNHIDMAAAKSHGISVTNTPGAVTDATADIGMSLLLMSARRLSEGERLVRRKEWTGWHPTQLLGQHVSGKTVGIIGMGQIGQAIARRCHFGFGMKVAYFNRSPKTLEFPATRYENVLDVAKQSDFLVLALAANEETHHLIDKTVFEALQPHAHFVNIARGDIVNEADLIDALQSGQIAGAGLDVYEFEPKIPDEFLAMDNVVLLPHLGTASLEVRVDMGMMAVENIKAFVAGAPLPNLL